MSKALVSDYFRILDSDERKNHPFALRKKTSTSLATMDHLHIPCLLPLFIYYKVIDMLRLIKCILNVFTWIAQKITFINQRYV